MKEEIWIEIRKMLFISSIMWINFLFFRQTNFRIDLCIIIGKITSPRGITFCFYLLYARFLFLMRFIYLTSSLLFVLFTIGLIRSGVKKKTEIGLGTNQINPYQIKDDADLIWSSLTLFLTRNDLIWINLYLYLFRAYDCTKWRERERETWVERKERERERKKAERPVTNENKSDSRNYCFVDFIPMSIPSILSRNI